MHELGPTASVAGAEVGDEVSIACVFEMLSDCTKSRLHCTWMLKALCATTLHNGLNERQTDPAALLPHMNDHVLRMPVMRRMPTSSRPVIQSCLVDEPQLGHRLVVGVFLERSDHVLTPDLRLEPSCIKNILDVPAS